MYQKLRGIFSEDGRQISGQKGQIPTEFVKVDKRNAQKEDVEGVGLYFQDM